MTSTTEYLSVAETAKLVRAALKRDFPGVKFSVRSDSYAGGASIRVRYEDGPTVQQVQGTTSLFTGSSFDAMIDLKSYHDTLLADEDGNVRTVHFGADYVFVDRDYSAATMEAVTAELGEALGRDDLDFARFTYTRVRKDNGKGWKDVRSGHNGESWNAFLPVHVDSDGVAYPLSGGGEYGNTVIHRMLNPRDLREGK